ncbi:hypothetical protein [Acinetobacter sp. CFCC 10889]|uniref:hypothetical protein n=1 Tax=Acinetobacter sp. CFCC 10889 TaxID=1775557 RepID=UPI000DCFC4D8|nr:hypothetical protein [Acinetobacter sp. CFCC 10889]
MFKAFENGTESHSIHDLTLENGEDRINIYGNLQIAKDQDGLQAAKILQTYFNDIVKVLEQEANLPEKISTETEGEVENPFL